MNKLLMGIVAAAGIALATPAMSQVYFGGGGVVVGPNRGYYNDGYVPRRAYRTYGYEDRGYVRCRTRWVETRYGMRRIKRCW
jgi:hypothetical protein